MSITPLYAFLVCETLLVATASGADFKYTPRRATPGNDVTCIEKDKKDIGTTKYTKYSILDTVPGKCRVCAGNGVAPLMAACLANDQCGGFDVEDNACGFLKSAAGPGKSVYTEDSGTFCLAGSGQCAGEWTVKPQTDIEGHDLDCNAKDSKGNRVSYCVVRADPTMMADACKANPDCKAFVLVKGFEGYLKTATGPTRYNESAVAFIKA